jgi:hypothetical protein
MTPLERLFSEVAGEEDRMLLRSGAQERLTARLQTFEAPKPRARRRTVVALTAAAAVAAALVLWIAMPREPLSVRVGGTAATLAGAWLGAPEDRALPLEFSDGTRMELSARSRARLIDLRHDGAEVELGSGRLHVQVVPKRAADWRLNAGPFAVRVTGTRFDVSYVPADDTFELTLDEGQVELTGCVFGGGRKVAAGQTVRASCRTRSLEVSYGDAKVRAKSDEHAPEASPAKTAAPPAAASGVTPIASAPEPSRKPGADRREPAWATLAKKDDHEQALAAAEAAGFETECARASTAELSLLAEAAGRSGASSRAVFALTTLRKRFPGSSEAALAAFSLGRLEFDERGSYETAAQWFRTYLDERPQGALRREALGRTVEALYRAGGAPRARDVAARYLAEYPAGPHAELAARISAP